MADYVLVLADHPAQARHPITNTPLFKDGKKVPLLPEHRSIRLDGEVIGYVSPGPNVQFIVPLAKLGIIADEARALVVEEFGEIKKQGAVPTLQPRDDDEPEDNEGDE